MLYKAIVVLWLLLTMHGTIAAPVSNDELKAAFTFNFAKFVEWPETEQSVTQDFFICLVGYTAVTEALKKFADKQVREQAVKLRHIDLPGDVSQCRILFIGDQDPSRLRRGLATLAGLPILTVSDLTDFASDGGMIGLIQQGKRLNFEINLDAIEASGLQLETRFLKLAAKVYSSEKRTIK